MIVATRSSLAAFFCALALAGACDRAADCASVCVRYQSCFDAEYDVDTCKDRCNERSDDEEFRARANECDACINERDCIDTVFSCGAECVDVIE